MNLPFGIQKWLSAKKKERVLAQKYLFHKKEFSIPESQNILIFENQILGKNEPFMLECSCKVSPEGVFAGRFNIGYKSKIDHKKKISQILDFFREYSGSGSVVLDRERLNRIIHDLQSFAIAQIGFAIDVREEKEESRLKVAMIISGKIPDVKRLAEAYKDHELYGLIKESLTSTNLLCAYDFYPDGRSAMKLYPLYKKDDLNHLIEKKIIPENERIRKMISVCRTFHLAFKNTQSEKVYHFRPRNEETFVRDLNNKVMSDVHAKILTCPHRYKLIVGIPEDEIVSGKIVNANIYY